MRVVLAAMAMLVLGGCELQRQIEENRRQADIGRCSGYGFQPGTPDFARCMMQMDARRDQRITEQRRANAELQAEQNRLYEQMHQSNRDMLKALRTPQPQPQPQPQRITPFTCNRVGNYVNCY